MIHGKTQSVLGRIKAMLSLCHRASRQQEPRGKIRLYGVPRVKVTL